MVRAGHVVGHGMGWQHGMVAWDGMGWHRMVAWDGIGWLWGHGMPCPHKLIVPLPLLCSHIVPLHYAHIVPPPCAVAATLCPYIVSLHCAHIVPPHCASPLYPHSVPTLCSHIMPSIMPPPLCSHHCVGFLNLGAGHVVGHGMVAWWCYVAWWEYGAWWQQHGRDRAWDGMGGSRWQQMAAVAWNGRGRACGGVMAW